MREHVWDRFCCCFSMWCRQPVDWPNTGLLFFVKQQLEWMNPGRPTYIYYLCGTTMEDSKIVPPRVLTAGEAHCVWNSPAVANVASRTGGSIHSGRSPPWIFWGCNDCPETCTHHLVPWDRPIVEMALQAFDLMQRHRNIHTPAWHRLLVCTDEDKVPVLSCPVMMICQVKSLLIKESIALGSYARQLFFVNYESRHFSWQGLMQGIKGSSHCHAGGICMLVQAAFACLWVSLACASGLPSISRSLPSIWSPII
jgi:hypothetical protein